MVGWTCIRLAPLALAYPARIWPEALQNRSDFSSSVTLRSDIQYLNPVDGVFNNRFAGANPVLWYSCLA